MLYLNTDTGEWVVIPVVENVVEQPAVRMITDNCGAQSVLIATFYSGSS